MNVYRLDDHRRAIDKRPKAAAPAPIPPESAGVMAQARALEYRATYIAEKYGRDAGLQAIDQAVREIGELDKQHPHALLIENVRSLLAYRQRLASRRQRPMPPSAA